MAVIIVETRYIPDVFAGGVTTGSTKGLHFSVTVFEVFVVDPTYMNATFSELSILKIP